MLSLGVKQSIHSVVTIAETEPENNFHEDFLRRHGKIELEKLVLFSEALASITLEEERTKKPIKLLLV